MYTFDEGVNRVGTSCEKWDRRAEVFGTEDVLPMWVADMDFAAPQPVIDALQARVLHGAFGYTNFCDADYNAVLNWVKRRHGVSAERDWVRFSPGVVDSQRVAICAVTNPGDTVVLFTPVYGPFFNSVTASGRVIRRSLLLHTEEGWRIDYDDLEAAFKEGAKAIAFCNPHNPIGRVWTREEIAQVVELAHRYHAVVISDEIHSDLEMPGYKVTPILTVDPDAIQLISATKTFNLAALRHSSVLIANPDIRKAFDDNYYSRGIDGINMFGALAQRVAYEQGEPWLDELLVYIDGNRKIVEQAIDERMPQIRYSRLEGTYLMWLDMRALNMNQKDLMAFCVNKARIGFTDGTAFGEEGAGFMRLNLATPRRNVIETMDRLDKALRAL